MRNAWAVVGLNYGDEGKGRIVSELAEPVDVVVKHNGGSQAGHTVLCPDGTHKFIFSQYGSGTFSGAATYLASTFVVDPVVLAMERSLLERHADANVDRLYAHPSCRVATFYDVDFNQSQENLRGDVRHGSCGHGVFSTIKRNIFATDSIDNHSLSLLEIKALSRANILAKLKSIRSYYEIEYLRAGMEAPASLRDDSLAETVADGLIDGSEHIKITADPETIFNNDHGWYIFESGQGLMLDYRWNRESYPHLTPSNTGVENVLGFLKNVPARLEYVDFVTRPYITRHGAGPLPNEISIEELLKIAPRFSDKTNAPNQYQGKLRFAPWTEETVVERSAMLNQIKDLCWLLHKDVCFEIKMTCGDQMTREYLDEIYGVFWEHFNAPVSDYSCDVMATATLLKD